MALLTKLNSFQIGWIYTQIFKLWRQRRFALFLRLLSPRPSQRLLDIGGFPGFWAQIPVICKSIDTLNVFPISWDPNAFPERHIRVLVGDGCALDLPDKSYDIAFSNSVIEHVGSWQRQQAFAGEIRRVGKAVWVQTPAFGCPIEPHYLAPFVHWLPKKLQPIMVRWLTLRGWIQKPSAREIDEMIESTHLLTKREMRQLFPDCEIRTEHLLGFIPKSFIAIRRSA